MTVYAYDTEFIEHGVHVGTFPFGRDVRTIELISIGIVCEDGREYYAVNRDAPWVNIRRNEWLVENVIPTMPLIHDDRRKHIPKDDFIIDFKNPVVKPHAVIADEVRDFLLTIDIRPIELWADYSAYDHVLLGQLWGRMVDIPPGIPMYTNDLRHEAASNHLYIPEPENETHNALDDARHVMRVLREEWGHVR